MQKAVVNHPLRDIAALLEQTTAFRLFLTMLLVSLLSSGLPTSAYGQPISTGQQSHAVILQYHHVSEQTPPATSISPARFEQHLEWLAAQKFNIWPLPKLIEALKQRQPLPERVAAITFDDGYLNVYQNAYPLLKARQWPFTVFVNTEPHDRRFASHMSWQQLKELADNGVTIANHTVSHAFLVRRNDQESQQQWLARIHNEVVQAEQRIQQQTGQNHQLLAYPYGEATDSLRAHFSELGYIGFGQQSGPVGPDSDFSLLPRFPLSGIYASLKGLKDKLLSRPMPISSIKVNSVYEDGITPNTVTQPQLTITLQAGKFRHHQLACFASGQGRIQVEIVQQAPLTFRVQANQPLPVGRSRYNCTMPSSIPGSYYWYSFGWLRPGPALPGADPQQQRWLHQ